MAKSKPTSRKFVVTATKTTRKPRTVNPAGRLDIAAEAAVNHGLRLVGGYFNLPDLATVMAPVVHDVVSRCVPKKRLTPQQLEQVLTLANTAGRIVVQPHIARGSR